VRRTFGRQFERRSDMNPRRNSRSGLSSSRDRHCNCPCLQQTAPAKPGGRERRRASRPKSSHRGHNWMVNGRHQRFEKHFQPAQADYTIRSRQLGLAWFLAYDGQWACLRADSLSTAFIYVSAPLSKVYRRGSLHGKPPLEVDPQIRLGPRR